MTDDSKTMGDGADDAARDNWSAFNDAYVNGHQQFTVDAEQRDRYYVGDQWDEATLEALGDRPALTINMALKTINAIKGHYSSTRADIVYKAGKDTTDLQANLMTQVSDSILHNNKYQFRESDMFDDGIITDRGYLDVRLDFETNILGDIRITARDPRNVLLSPQASEYDPDEWPEVIITEWWSPEDVEATYGKDKADRVRGAVDSGDYFGTQSIRFGQTINPMGSGIDSDLIRSVRIIDRQYRKIGMVKEFIDLATGDISRIPDDWDADRIQRVASMAKLGVRKRMVKRIRWTVSCDQVTLFDEWSPYDEFTVIPFFPYFRRGKPAGVMKMLISPQDQLNKTESQMLHIVNTTANSGWHVEAGSLVNMSPEDLEDRGAETGLVIVHGRNRQPPTKIQPNTIPTGLDHIAKKSSVYISDIPGVTPLVGQEMKTSIAGVAMQRAQSTAMAGLQPVFDNLNRTRMLLGAKIMKMVQRFYTEPRVIAATDWRSSDPQTQQFSINSGLLDDLSLGKYELIVSSAPQRDTWQDMQFQEGISLREAGIPIPGHYIVQQSHLANKAEIAETLKHLEGLSDPTQEQQQQAQMQAQAQQQMVQLQLEKINAEIGKLRADAALSQAKASMQQPVAEAEAQKISDKRLLELEQQRNDLMKQAATLQNKKELAAMHIGAKLQTTRYTALMKSMDNRAKAATQKQMPLEG
jgi:hypothetical protein